MSGFSARWLGLREAADHRSRFDFSAACDAPGLRDSTIVDLGCGTGSNLRYLRSRLSGGRRWTCIDNDRTLLEVLRQSKECRHATNEVTVLEADLATDVGGVIAAATAGRDPQTGLMVTASALLDLVSETWLETLVSAGARMDAAFWVALTYDGRIELEPGHEADALLSRQVNAHQLTDKGFGSALGPRAHAYAVQALERVGYVTQEATSDWLLGPDEVPLIEELLSGWLSAAREFLGDEGLLADWEIQRREQLNAGCLEVRVGHRDLLALPASSA